MYVRGHMLQTINRSKLTLSCAYAAWAFEVCGLHPSMMISSYQKCITKAEETGLIGFIFYHLWFVLTSWKLTNTAILKAAFVFIYLTF